MTYGVSTLLFGFSKTAAPGLGAAVVPFLASEFPARLSTGLVLSVLVTADVIAVVYFRRSAKWQHLARLLPWTGVGVVIGFLLLGRVDDVQLARIIAAAVIAVVVVGAAREVVVARASATGREKADGNWASWWFAAALGVVAGVTTMVSNAAGPIVTIYLLAMGLPPREFLGTGAWFYLIINVFKVPFSASLGLITPATLALNAMALPLIVGGGLVGIVVVSKLPERAFKVGMRLLALGAVVRLLF